MNVASRRTALGGAVASIAMALLISAVVLAPTDARADDATVNAVLPNFSPATVNINVGDTVTWTNTESVASGIPHTSTSDTGVWDSGNLAPGESFNFTFTEPGTYAYGCDIHPAMSGTVVVAQQTTVTATATTATATATTATATATTATATATTPAATSTPTATATSPAATATSPADDDDDDDGTAAPAPPDTGTGNTGGGSNSLLFFAAGLLGLGVTGAGFAALRRRN